MLNRSGLGHPFGIMPSPQHPSCAQHGRLLTRSLTLPAAAGSAVAQAAEAVSADPQTAAVAAGVGVGLPLILFWQTAFGGYSGALSAEETLDVLQVRSALPFWMRVCVCLLLCCCWLWCLPL